MAFSFAVPAVHPHICIPKPTIPWRGDLVFTSRTPIVEAVQAAVIRRRISQLIRPAQPLGLKDLHDDRYA
jgi:hypothetical protein